MQYIWITKQWPAPGSLVSCWNIRLLFDRIVGQELNTQLGAGYYFVIRESWITKQLWDDDILAAARRTLLHELQCICTHYCNVIKWHLEVSIVDKGDTSMKRHILYYNEYDIPVLLDNVPVSMSHSLLWRSCVVCAGDGLKCSMNINHCVPLIVALTCYGIWHLCR